MARQRRFKKFKLPSPRVSGKALEVAGERFGTVAVSILFLIIMAALLNSFIHSSDYFKVRSVETKGARDGALALSVNADLLKKYRNRNIFAVDVKAAMRYLESRYPDLKYVAVRRSLPDMLSVDMAFRRPFALVGTSKYYCVDQDGYVIFEPDLRGLALPVISGVDAQAAGLSSRRIDSRNLKAALDLLKEFSRNRAFSRRRILKVDASSLSSLAFYLEDGLEVRIGAESFKERLEALRRALKGPRPAKQRVDYIDVRFDDVLMGAK